MEPEDIKISDWYRIVMGEAPPMFLVEVLIRTIFIYLILMVSMRILGKRLQSTLSIYERIALVSLSAAIGMGLQVPERGLLPVIIISIIVICIHKAFSLWTYRNKRFEAISHGTLITLIKDGVLQIPAMEKIAISRQIVFAELRFDGIENLGKVRRMFFETSGAITKVLDTEPVAGLSIIPEWDTDFINEQKKSAKKACKNCGYTHSQTSLPHTCPECFYKDWVQAIVS